VLLQWVYFELLQKTVELRPLEGWVFFELLQKTVGLQTVGLRPLVRTEPAS